MNQTQEEQTEPVVDAVSPDELMKDFRGKPFVKIVIVTVIAHVLFVGVFSYGYIKSQFVSEEDQAGKDTSDLSEEERLELAEKEGESALRKIAGQHDVNYRELTKRFGGGGDAKAFDTSGGNPPPVDADGNANPESDYEKDLKNKLNPPADPDLTGGIEEEEAIFPE